MHLYLIAEVSEYFTYKEVCVIERINVTNGYDINYSNGVIWTYFLSKVKTVKKAKRCVNKRVAQAVDQIKTKKGIIKSINWRDMQIRNLTSLPISLTVLDLSKSSNKYLHEPSVVVRHGGTYEPLYYEDKLDITPLAGLRLLELNLRNRFVVDITSLPTTLTTLKLSNTRVKDITRLKYMSELTYLSLAMTLVIDVTPLAELFSLTTLYLKYTQITDVTPLATLPLTLLNITCSKIRDTSMISKACKIRTLN